MLAGAGDEALLGLAGVADADTDVLTGPVGERLRAMLGSATTQGVTPIRTVGATRRVQR